ncbi:hypothetical protein CQ10_00140 [Bradyrhizobium valentinum]|nr:hypothetical protein CQ10_00140 [Bradyrhizobium valentinum]
MAISKRGWALCDGSRRKQEAIDILRYELNPQRFPEGVEAEDVQILRTCKLPKRTFTLTKLEGSFRGKQDSAR